MMPLLPRQLLIQAAPPADAFATDTPAATAASTVAAAVKLVPMPLSRPSIGIARAHYMCTVTSSAVPNEHHRAHAAMGTICLPISIRSINNTCKNDVKKISQTSCTAHANVPFKVMRPGHAYAMICLKEPSKTCGKSEGPHKRQRNPSRVRHHFDA